MEILRACHSLFLKAPMIEELAAEGGLRGSLKRSDTAMSDNITIRSACESDAAALARIYAHYVEKTAITFEYTAPDMAEMERRRQEISRHYPYLVAETDGKVIGYAYAHAFYGREAYAWSVESSIYVDVNARKHGIGRKLYEALEKALKSMGILNINALATPWSAVSTTAATNSTVGMTSSVWKK